MTTYAELTTQILNYTETTTDVLSSTITDDFIEIVGNIPVSTLSKDSIRTYISTQIKLPPSRRKNPKYREMSIVEVMKLKGVKPQSRINVNKFLTRLTTFMNFGVCQ